MKTWTLSEIGHVVEYGPRMGESVPDTFIEATPVTLASSEMLGALKDSITTFKDFEGEQMSYIVAKNLHALIAQIRTAIAKAEGRNGND